ncbi:MAG: serine hydrolase domain-containing protein [Parvularculaceae bacterium]
MMIVRTVAAVIAAAMMTGAAAAADKQKPEEAFTPPSTLEELGARLADALAESKTVGMQVTIVDATGAVWTGEYGYLDKEKTRPVEQDSVFRAGSISKSFTGTLAQMLVEDGVLDLNQTLHAAAPEIEFVNKWEATDPVLLVDLSEHTTGWDDIQFSEYKDFGPDATLLDGIAFNPKSRTSRWKPGRYASYNNVGPSILGYVMEKKTGASFDALMQTRIFGPLGMENVSFRRTEAIAAKLSKSYSDKGVEEPFVNIGMPPAGSLNTSATELSKFVALLIRRGEANGSQLISPEGADRIATPTRAIAARAGLRMGYGLGVYTSPTKEYGVVTGHNGGIDGFISEYGFFRDADAGYVMMLNTPDGDLYRKVRKLLLAYLRAQHPTPPAAAAQPDGDLARYEGMYRQITPRTEFIRFLFDVMDIAKVEAKDGKLVVSPPFGEGVTLTPLGNGLFAAEGGTQADRILTLSPEGDMEMIRFLQSAYVRVGFLDAWWRPALIALALIGTVLTVLMLVFWCVLRPFGLFRASGRWRVWTAPLLAYVSLGVLAGAFMLGSAGNSASFTANLGAPSLYSWTAALATIAFAVFSVIAFASVFLAQNVTRGARIIAGFSSATLLALALYLFSYGWIGMTIWSYTPMVSGV